MMTYVGSFLLLFKQVLLVGLLLE